MVSGGPHVFNMVGSLELSNEFVKKLGAAVTRNFFRYAMSANDIRMEELDRRLGVSFFRGYGFGVFSESQWRVLCLLPVSVIGNGPITSNPM